MRRGWPKLKKPKQRLGERRCGPDSGNATPRSGAAPSHHLSDLTPQLPASHSSCCRRQRKPASQIRHRAADVAMNGLEFVCAVLSKLCNVCIHTLGGPSGRAGVGCMCKPYNCSVVRYTCAAQSQTPVLGLCTGENLASHEQKERQVNTSRHPA